MHSKDSSVVTCIEGNVISIEFAPSFMYSDLDTLYIDNIKFAHSFYMDSIKTGKYLPKEKVIFFEDNGKQVYEKTNKILMARILASNLKSHNKYKIENPKELILKGILKVSRKDEKKISVCITENHNSIIIPVS